MTNEIRAKLDKIGALAWASADSMRGNMNPNQYQGPLLGLLCYSFLSKKFEEEAARAFGNETTYKDEWEEGSEEYRLRIQANFIDGMPGYFIKPEHLFKRLYENAKAGTFNISDLSDAIDDFNSAIRSAPQRNKDIFEDLFEMLSINSSITGTKPTEKAMMFSDIIINVQDIQNQINEIQEEDPTVDALAYIYEYLLARFAASAGKKGGEFLTPNSACKLLSKLVLANVKNPRGIKNVSDPTCGTLSLVNAFIEELSQINEETANNIKIYGQEKNTTTAQLAKINMLLHNVPSQKFNVFIGDTLTNDGFMSNGALTKFDIQIANPPYSVNHLLKENALKSDPRFNTYSKLAPKTKADFAFVQHMIAHASDKGHIGVILPHGVLFRGSSELSIRKEIFKIRGTHGFNIIDGIIGLPANMFYGTGIPVCMIILNKEKTDDKIIFIDASKNFVKGKQNYLNDEQIDRIVTVFKERKSVDKFAKLVSMEEIEANDYNLNIPRYVDTSEDVEEIDAEKVLKELELLDAEIAETKAKIMETFNSLIK